MFSNCESLTSLNLNNFNTSKVSNMTGMFNNCNNLTNLDLSNFKTNLVTAMTNLFKDCSNLTSLDLRNWEFNEEILMNESKRNDMFKNINSNIIIKIDSIDMKNKLMSIYKDFTDENFQFSG